MLESFATDCTDFHGSMLEFSNRKNNYTEAAKLLIREIGVIRGKVFYAFI
jgi:hypothetical protein